MEIVKILEVCLYILSASFLVLGLTLITIKAVQIIKTIIETKKKEANSFNIDSILRTITEEKDAEKVAQCFISLLYCSYMLIHTLINSGNRYDDKVQSEMFKRSLTSDTLKALNSLEGKYE